jgi:hypothetical protein
MEYNEQKFIAGFNSGYLLAKYEPELLTSLLRNISPMNSYISGMSFGQKEYEMEKDLVDISKLRLDRNRSIDSREL